MSDWRKIEIQLFARGTCRTSRFELTTSKRGVIWIDQVSLMPSDTYKVNCFFILCLGSGYWQSQRHDVIWKQLVKILPKCILPQIVKPYRMTGLFCYLATICSRRINHQIVWPLLKIDDDQNVCPRALIAD
jgi:hypothetical protein